MILDTQVVLWSLIDEARLSERAQDLIRSRTNTAFVSVASAWEIAIKKALGKLAAPSGLEQELERCGFSTLPVTFEHAEAVASLPMYHRDPFDRMLVVQAQKLKIPIVTADRAIHAYDVKIIW